LATTMKFQLNMGFERAGSLINLSVQRPSVGRRREAEREGHEETRVIHPSSLEPETFVKVVGFT